MSMTDTASIQQKLNFAFKLLCANFVMFLVLFAGLGYLTWQSVTLLGQVKNDLRQAEARVVKLQDRVEKISAETIAGRVATNLTAKIGQSVKATLAESESAQSLEQSLQQSTQKITATYELAEDSYQQLHQLNDKLATLDSQEFANNIAQAITNSIKSEISELIQSQTSPIPAQ